MEQAIKIPKISEDADTGIVAEIYVSEGDTIEEGQDIIALDSDKASVNVPADASGEVKSIKLKVGDEAKVGDVILVLEVEKEEESDNDQQSEKEEQQEQEEQAASEKKEQAEAEKENSPKEAKSQGDEQEKAEEDDDGLESADAPSAPLAKKFARELGVDIIDLETDDAEDRITREDVMAYAKKIIEEKSNDQKQAAEKGEQQGIAPIELPDFSQYGETEEQPLSGIRLAVAENTVKSWQNIPHVTHHDKANLTQLNDFLKQKEEEGEKLSMTAMMTKIVAAALQNFPKFNASLDMKNRKVIYKKYYHIGIAVDTKEGLLMPVVRDVDQKPLAALSGELGELAEKARNHDLAPDEMKGGNIVVSNLGGIGGTSFTPVIFPPQVAILGISSAEIEAVYNGTEFEPQPMLPLSLSYDHRLIDGAEAARFLRWICEVIEQPFKLLSKG